MRIPFVRQTTIYDCGPACAAMLVRAFGVRVPAARLRRLMRTTPRDGTSRKNLVGGLRRLGFGVEEGSGTSMRDLAAALKDGRAVVINYREPEDDESHYAVVVALTPSRIILHDPWHGPRFALSRQAFARRWYGRHRTVGTRWSARVRK
jgi:ATP-binding cassette subfamily B protein